MWPFRRKPDMLALEVLTDTWMEKTLADHDLEAAYHAKANGSPYLLAAFDQWQAASDDLEHTYGDMRDVYQRGEGTPRELAERYHQIVVAYNATSLLLADALSKGRVRL